MATYQMVIGDSQKRIVVDNEPNEHFADKPQPVKVDANVGKKATVTKDENLVQEAAETLA
jgi:hypothetical protein